MTPFEFKGNGDVSILERDEQIETYMYKYTYRLPKYKFWDFFSIRNQASALLLTTVLNQNFNTFKTFVEYVYLFVSLSLKNVVNKASFIRIQVLQRSKACDLIFHCINKSVIFVVVMLFWHISVFTCQLIIMLTCHFFIC